MEKFFDIVCRVGRARAERGRARRDGARRSSTTAAIPDGGADGDRGAARRTSPATSGSSASSGSTRSSPSTASRATPTRRSSSSAGSRSTHGAYAAEVNDGVRARRRGRGGAGGGGRRGGRRAVELPPLYPLDDPIEREDRGDRDAGLRRRRGLPAAGRARARSSELDERGPRRAADLHGEDAPLALARPDARERADRLHGDGARPARVHRRRLARRPLRRHADDAGLGATPAAHSTSTSTSEGRTVGLF